MNRKNYHSINVQMICNADCHVLDAVARWPGGTHDSFTLQNSTVGMRLEEGAVRSGWLVGEHLLFWSFISVVLSWYFQ